MKKLTKLMLTLTLLVLGVGGVNATKLYATYGTPASNGTWDAETGSYSWTLDYSNLMTIFSFTNGELADYKSLHLSTSNYTDTYRVCFMNGSTAVATIAFYSAGQKDLVFAERNETKDLDLSKITNISFGGASGSGSIVITGKPYLQKPMSLDFDETGKAYIDLTDISVSDENLSYDDQTGTVTSTGTSGTINITFDRAYDLSGMTHWTATMTGDDIVEHWKLVGATNNGSALDMYSGEFDRAFPGSLADPDFTAITGITMYVNASGTLTFSDGGIYITSSVINASDGAYSSTALTKDMFKNWTSSDADASESDETIYPTVNLGTAQGTGSTIFGDPSVSHLNYADISEFDELVINGTPNKNVRAFFNRETATSAGRPDATQMMDAEGNTTFDLASIKAEYGFVHLNVIKIPYDSGTERTINSLTLRKKNTGAVYNYTFSGNGVLSKSALAALADETATAIDATGITKATALETANPNCLIVANEDMVTNAQNVIVDGTCANLVLTDKKPFKAPADFTATTASFEKTLSDAATMVLPFAATIPSGIEAYNLTGVDGDAVTAVKVDAISADQPVLLNGTGTVTFTGSNAAVAATAAGAVNNGVLYGVYADGYVPAGSYVLQKQGENLGFYPVAADNTISVAPFRAYLTAGSSARALRIVYADETTGIENIEHSTLNIEHYYDLQGRRVAQPTKGLYIVRSAEGRLQGKNGKKVMVK